MSLRRTRQHSHENAWYFTVLLCILYPSVAHTNTKTPYLEEENEMEKKTERNANLYEKKKMTVGALRNIPQENIILLF